MKIKYVLPVLGILAKVLSSDYGLYQFLKYEPLTFLLLAATLFIIGCFVDKWTKTVSDAQIKEN